MYDEREFWDIYTVKSVSDQSNHKGQEIGLGGYAAEDRSFIDSCILE